MMSIFRICAIAILLSLAAGDVAAPAAAAKLYPVKVENDGDCPIDVRRIEGVKAILIVRSGCEDGADEDFVRIEKDGSHKRLFGFAALAVDARGLEWTGISDKAKVLPSMMGRDGIEIWVTFAHTRQHSGEVCFPLGQRRYPIVLFSFGDRPPAAAFKGRRFRRMSLSRVIREARRVPPGGRATLECDIRCCYPTW